MRPQGNSRFRAKANVPVGLSILHIVSAPAAGGIEVYVKQLVIELKRLGHCPRVGFVAHASDHGRSAEFERQYLTELTSAGVEYFFIGDSSRKNPLIGAWRIWRYSKSKRVQIYHSHLALGILFGIFVRAPRLHTHHSSITRLPLWVYRLLNPLVSQYIGISNLCAALLEQFTGREAAIVHNGIDVGRFAPYVRGESEIIQCISVGRIVGAKNHRLLLDAIALLPTETRGRLHLWLVGEGVPHLVADLERLVRQLGLSPTVSLLGNRLDVPLLLGRSHLFVMSSAWEGFPISLLEATASGLPFIATDVGGCREVAEICGNGVIVPPADPQALSKALNNLVTAPQQRVRLSVAAVRNALEFSIEKAAKEHLRIYEDLLAWRAR